MSNNILSTSLSAESTVLHPAITLEQLNLNKFSVLTNNDIQQMVTLARSGISAHTYKLPDCPVEITGTHVTTELEFYLWPYPLNLDYEITVTDGSLAPYEAVELDREYQVIFPVAESVTLPWDFDLISLTQESPAIGGHGQTISNPGFHVDGNKLRTSEPVFCVLRLTVRAKGFKYTNQIAAEKHEGFKTTDLKSQVSVTFGDEQEETLDLEIPDCVDSYLASCPSGQSYVNDGCKDNGKPQMIVYYSICDGSVLGIEKKDSCDD